MFALVTRPWHARAFGLWTVGLAIACSVLLGMPARAQPTSKPASKPAAKSAAAGGTKMLVAVLDLDPVGASKTEAVAVSERLREELLRSGRITLVDRAQINAVLDEQAFQQTGCTSQECAVQAGKVLGVQQLVTGKVIKLGESAWQVSVTMVKVETSETLKAESLRHRGDLFSLTDQPMAVLAAKLTGAPIASVPPPAASPPIAAAPPLPKSGVPPRKWEAGQPLRIALFPIHIFGGTLEQRPWWPSAVVAGVKRVPHTQLAYTWYPNKTPGQSLAGDTKLPDEIRSSIMKSPDFPAIQAKGKQLGVDAVLVINHTTSAQNATAWLIDTETGHISKQSAILRSQAPGGLKRIATQAVADVVQQMRDGM